MPKTTKTKRMRPALRRAMQAKKKKRKKMNTRTHVAAPASHEHDVTQPDEPNHLLLCR
jgi:hypothetical protein